jgi:hypothetical protein
MENEGLGFKFWAGMAGVVLAVGIGLMIVFFLFSRAVYAWGVFGAFLALALVLIIVAWFIDRRKVREYETE